MAERCVSCGKFVSYSEMKQGGGASFHFEPLNEFGPEVSEWTCSQCSWNEILLVRDAAGSDNVAEWNDAPERTQAEVLAAFDKAILLAEAAQ